MIFLWIRVNRNRTKNILPEIQSIFKWTLFFYSNLFFKLTFLYKYSYFSNQLYPTHRSGPVMMSSIFNLCHFFFLLFNCECVCTVTRHSEKCPRFISFYLTLQKIRGKKENEKRASIKNIQLDVPGCLLRFCHLLRLFSRLSPLLL